MKFTLWGRRTAKVAARRQGRVIDSVETLQMLEAIVARYGANHTGRSAFVAEGGYSCIAGVLAGELGYSVNEMRGANLPRRWHQGVTFEEENLGATRRVVFTEDAAMLLEEARVMNDHGEPWGLITRTLADMESRAQRRSWVEMDEADFEFDTVMI